MEAPAPEEAPMLFRARATLQDRPGALAELAARCGEARVNILAMQIFPGLEGVTDELVLRTPLDWGIEEVLALLASAGATRTAVRPCTESALVDQPTRFVQAARTVLAQPARFPEVVAGLFDAEPEPTDAGDGDLDVMEMTVGDVVVHVRRSSPFTATEHVRASAMADLVSDVMTREAAALAERVPGLRLDTSVRPDYVESVDAVTALVAGTAVGVALLGEEPEPGVRRVSLDVDPAWRRRGIGARLLRDVARLATGQGAEEIVMRTAADNRAVLPMVFSSGLRGRIRTSASELVVRVPLRDLRKVPGQE